MGDALNFRRTSFCLLLAAFLAACPRKSAPGSLPDPRLTPGDVLDVTEADVCEPGYTRRVREVSAKTKRMVFSSYRRVRIEGRCCEVDHLIPLELGGSNRITNLWPEPNDGIWNASVKDQLERRLHGLVCSGQIDLKTAQVAISTNWIEAYAKYEGSPAPVRR